MLNTTCRKNGHSSALLNVDLAHLKKLNCIYLFIYICLFIHIFIYSFNLCINIDYIINFFLQQTPPSPHPRTSGARKVTVCWSMAGASCWNHRMMTASDTPQSAMLGSPASPSGHPSSANRLRIQTTKVIHQKTDIEFMDMRF